MSQKCTVGNFGTTYLDPKSKNNCTLFSSIFHVEPPVSRYGCLKLKFLCERYSHCTYSSCSIQLTKTRNTWSLTAVQNEDFKNRIVPQVIVHFAHNTMQWKINQGEVVRKRVMDDKKGRYGMRPLKRQHGHIYSSAMIIKIVIKVI